MIKSLEIYTIICDNCGKNYYDDSEFSGFNDKDYVVEDALDNDWIEHDNDHICSDCYEYDDDDNIVIKKKDNPNAP